jgi:hypothetical protein
VLCLKHRSSTTGLSRWVGRSKPGKAWSWVLLLSRKAQGLAGVHKNNGGFMIINHNMSAINSHRVLKFQHEEVSKSMEKLSSGMRINRGGDDASGLAVSEKMRTQVAGLRQAERNTEDGMSMIQTTEGYLKELSELLQRVRVYLAFSLQTVFIPQKIAK